MIAADVVVPVLRAPRDQFSLVWKPAKDPRGLPCWLAVPEAPDPTALPLVAIHGIRRNAQEQAALFATRAAELGRYVIAPLFDAESWPTYQRLGGAHCPDLALLGLLQQLQAEGVGHQGKFDLFGFSGGAQFAHRFAMLHPDWIDRLSVAASGWYTFPDTAAYPFGLGQRAGRHDDRGAKMQAALGEFLRLSIHVYVGDLDNTPDPNTRSGEMIDRRQGHHRLARAARWTEAVNSAAAKYGVDPRISLTVLPNVGHNFRNCMVRAGLANLVMLSRNAGSADLCRPVEPAFAAVDC